MQKLTDFGYNFQVKLIAALLSDRMFSSRVFDLLKPEYFDSDALEWLVRTILSYYAEYHTLATLDVIKGEMDSITDDVIRNEIVRGLQIAVNHVGSEDLEYIKNKTIDFCRNQELSFAIMESVELLKKKDFEGIKKVIDNAVRKGLETTNGIDYADTVDSRYSENSRKPIPTGFPTIDKLMAGGLSAGELAFIVGAGGSGKSWVLSTISANAYERGYNVLYISLELDANYVGVRHDCILTNYPTDVLTNHRDEIKHKISTINGGSLRLEWFPTRSLSMVAFRALVDRRILLGSRPDVIILDYIDLMKVPRSHGSRKDEALQELCEEMRGFSGEYGIPVWTASQANRGSHGEGVEHVDASMIAESMGKHYTADFMMSILRKKKDIAKGRARFHVIKNRFGDDQMDLLGTMDTRQGIVVIHDPKSREMRQMNDDMVEEETNSKLVMAKLYAQYHDEKNSHVVRTTPNADSD